jgi:colanic acid/amylovoran biosynthesis glycosyltransferase
VAVKIGYLVPEFPGQTHVFFWRELAALRGLGIEGELISTRRPLTKLVSHDWAREAGEQTTYLSPFGMPGLADAARELWRAGPAGWARVLGSVRRAEGVSAAGRLRLLALVVAGASLACIARQRSLGHIHVHSCADAAHVALFARLLGGPAYSLTLHGPLRDYGPNQREKWRHAAFGIAITQKLLGELREQLGEELPPRLEQAPMGVDLARAQRAEPYRSWDGEEPARVFSCGRLNPCKGHHDLIEAVGLLRERGIDARLEIAGAEDSREDAYRKQLEERIRARDLAPHVALLGAVSESTVLQGLHRAHVFALASREEPLGVAIMEAMAAGVPVVVTGAGGVPELVENGKDGILVAPGDPRALADALAHVLADAELATRLSRAGRAKVEASFQSGVGAAVLAGCVRAREAVGENAAGSVDDPCVERLG